MNIVNPVLDAILSAAQQVKSAPVERSDRVIPQVGEAFSSQGSRELKADSRLNDMPGRQGYPNKSFGNAYAYAPASPSTITQLNQSAKIIADLLYQFPVDPEDLYLTLPMLSRKDFMGTNSFSTLLRDTVELSGLFYQSHLTRWYRGDYPTDRLRQDMASRLLSEQGLQPQLPPAFTDLFSSPDDPLKAITRFQMELLTLPFLSLKGEIVSGVFAQILIFSSMTGSDPALLLPGVNPDDKPQGELTWRIAMRMEHEGFGICDIDVAIIHGTAHISLMSSSDLLLSYFRTDKDSLRDVFEKNGLSPVQINAGKMSYEQASMPFKKLFRINLFQSPGRGVDSVISNDYGNDNSRILAQAKKNKVAHPIHPELMGLLSEVNFDSKIDVSLYARLFVVASWVVEQMPYFEYNSNQ